MAEPLAPVTPQAADASLPPAKAPPAPISDDQAAAILLLLVSEQEAADIVARLAPADVEHLSRTMYSVADVGAGEISAVLDRFVERAQHRTTIGFRAERQIQAMLTTALGPVRADAMISRTAPRKPAAASLEALRWLAAKDILAMVEDRHPQILAAVLSFVSPTVAADVLRLLPEDEQDEVIYRLARLGEINGEAIAMLEALLSSHQAPRASGAIAAPGGESAEIAAIINLIDKKQGARIIKGLAKRDKILARAIEEQLFTFADFSGLDSKTLAAIMRSVDNSVLAPAVKGADDQLRQDMLAAMSVRAAQSLEDELAERGPIPLTEVIEAQRALVAQARKLADRGEIMLGGGADFV